MTKMSSNSEQPLQKESSSHGSRTPTELKIFFTVQFHVRGNWQCCDFHDDENEAAVVW